MKNKLPIISACVILLLLTIGATLSGSVTNALSDFIKISAPSNPPSGQGRIYIDSGTNKIACLNSDGTSCAPAGGGGSPGGSPSQWQYNSTGSFGGLVGTSAIPQTGWTVFNGALYDDFSASSQAIHSFQTIATNVRGITRSLPSSTSYTLIIRGMVTTQMVPNYTWTAGVVISDGTKYESIELLDANSLTSNPSLRVQQYTDIHTGASTVAGPTSGLVGNDFTFKIVGDAVHRTFFYWNAGAYTQFFQEAIGTFLTETAGGANLLNVSSNAQDTITMQILYVALTNP